MEDCSLGLIHAPFRESILKAVRLLRRGSADHLADASALPRVHLKLVRDAVLGIACGRRAWPFAIEQLFQFAKRGQDLVRGVL